MHFTQVSTFLSKPRYKILKALLDHENVFRADTKDFYEYTPSSVYCVPLKDPQAVEARHASIVVPFRFANYLHRMQTRRLHADTRLFVLDSKYVIRGRVVIATVTEVAEDGHSITLSTGERIADIAYLVLATGRVPTPAEVASRAHLSGC